MSFLKDKKKIAITAVVLSAALAIGMMSMHANASTKVKTYVAKQGGIVKITEVNGNIVSNETLQEYSVIDGKIAKINVKVGDYVKKGDVIISYDNEEIDRTIELAQLSIKETFGSCDNVVQTGGRSAGLYSEAKKTLEQLETEIANVQEVINITQNSLLEKQAALSREGANLQISLIDWADKPDSDEYKNLEKLVASNQSAQMYDPEIVRMQENLNVLNQQLAAAKELKAQMVTQKATGYAGLLTSGAKEQMDATKAKSELSMTKMISDLEAAKEGVRARFDGVVTSIGVSENESVKDGNLLFTVESAEDVVIKVNVNKYDIVDMEVGQDASASIKNKEYSGKVSRIEHMAGQGESGNIGVEIKLDEPDENIILGLETKVKVTSASLNDVITIPLDALCMDADENYVFVLKDKKAVKCAVTTGVKNDDSVEITSGISEGDVIIWNDETELADGMDVKME